MSDLIDKLAFSMWRSDQQHPERVTEDAFCNDPFRGDWRAQAEVAAKTILEEMLKDEESLCAAQDNEDYASGDGHGGLIENIGPDKSKECSEAAIRYFASSNGITLGEDK